MLVLKTWGNPECSVDVCWDVGGGVCVTGTLSLQKHYALCWVNSIALTLAVWAERRPWCILKCTHTPPLNSMMQTTRAIPTLSGERELRDCFSYLFILKLFFFLFNGYARLDGWERITSVNPVEKEILIRLYVPRYCFCSSLVLDILPKLMLKPKPNH